ncbi:MAG: hypothetical protein Q9170_003029 [Blastenia crenularia]
MADPLSTVAAVLSFADITFRACQGVHGTISSWREAPDTIRRLRQTIQSIESMSANLRLYVVEYESSKLRIEQHQLLPENVKDELANIELDIILLQGHLPQVGTEKTMKQRFRRIIDEKKISRIASRLDRRQATVTTALHILAQRNGIQLYEQISSIRNDLGLIDAAASTRLEEARSSMNRHISDTAQIGSDATTAQNSILDSVRTLVEQIPANYATISGKLDHLATTMEGYQGQLRTETIISSPAYDTIIGVVRAELRNIVIPEVEQYLNPYILRHKMQMDELRKNLDRIVSAVGILSAGQQADNKSKSNQESATEHQDDIFLHQRSDIKTADHTSKVVRNAKNSPVVLTWINNAAVKGCDEERAMTRIFQAALEHPPDTLLGWVSFLSDLDLNVDEIDEIGLTPLMLRIPFLISQDLDSPVSQRAILQVLWLCLSGAAVSIREPLYGAQALHWLFFYVGERSLSTSQFSDLAYILIRYGSADVHATMDDGRSPQDLAVHSGRQAEWEQVLRRCGIDPDDVYAEESRRLHRVEYVGEGDSTAIDTDDLPSIYSENIRQRKAIVGDRLEK